jgi:hypothetical protein
MQRSSVGLAGESNSLLRHPCGGAVGRQRPTQLAISERHDPKVTLPETRQLRVIGK